MGMGKMGLGKTIILDLGSRKIGVCCQSLLFVAVQLFRVISVGFGYGPIVFKEESALGSSAEIVAAQPKRRSASPLLIDILLPEMKKWGSETREKLPA